jgi:fumarate reductase flavoprotein subunit
LTCISYRTDDGVKGALEGADVAQIIDVSAVQFGAEVDVAIIGGGAAGLVAALRAREAGAEVLVIERDALPRGSTALSAGLIPAAGTRFQKAAGIADSVELFTSDILRKANGEPDPAAVHLLAATIGPAIEWLADRHGLPFSVIDNFIYPGHSVMRMHGLPARSGGELMDHLTAAAERAGVVMLTEAVADTLIREGEGLIRGVGAARPDGGRETVGCGALILACNGYGGNPALIARHAPEMAGALYFGHAGNQGDAVLWGEALGAGLRHLSGYQGHGSVAHPHGILITWATITEGGFQVNALGRRFHNEATGYSEAAAAICAQPGGVAWQVFDARIAAIARQFEDFRNAEAQGALLTGTDWSDIAVSMRIGAAALESAAAADSLKASGGKDAFGRDWAGVPRLQPPYHAVRVTGALFHTQGGLVLDASARVLRQDGTPFANLFAAGGAACGVSGSDASGYLSGNGLLSAVGYGFIAGEAASAAAGRGRQ